MRENIKTDFLFLISFIFSAHGYKYKRNRPLEEEKKIKKRNSKEDADITSSRTKQARERTNTIFFSEMREMSDSLSRVIY